MRRTFGTALMALALAAAATAGCGSGDGGTDSGEDVLVGDTTGDTMDAADDVPGTDIRDVEPGDSADSVDTAVKDEYVYEPVDDAWTPQTIGMDTAAPSDTTEPPAGIRVRVGSYNIYGYNWADAAHIGAFIKELNPDLMGLVESDSDQLPSLAAAAGYEYYCNAGGRSLMSKTPLGACSTIELVGDREILHTETEIEGVTFSVYEAHIDWDIAGVLQARDFIDNYFVNDTNTHVILMGDFNDEHMSRQQNIFEEQLADAFTAFGWYPGERVTWPSQYFDGTEGSQTIDLIYFRKSMRAIVLDADAVNMSPCLSDHKPVWADLLFPADETPFDDSLTMSKIDPLRVFGQDPANMPANLIVNWGAEDGLNGWTVEGGGVSTGERFGCQPSTEARFFAGFEKGYKPDEGYSRFTQVVDLSGSIQAIDTNTGWLNVSGEMISCPYLITEGDLTTTRVERYDDADIAVTFISADGTRTERHVSKRRDTLMWYPWADVIPIPPGTRQAEIALTAYKRVDYVGGIDAGFDNIYMSVSQGPRHLRSSIGDLLRFGMDEGAVSDTTDATIENNGWIARTTGTPLSLNGFPPASVSGLQYLFAGDEVGLTPLAEPVEISQGFDLAPLQDSLETESTLALRWGGWLRTNTAEGSMVTLYLRLYDGHGDLWAEIPGETIWQSEWLYQENLTRIPSGIRSARFVMKAEIPAFTGFLGIDSLEAQDDAVFADELFVRPELVMIVDEE